MAEGYDTNRFQSAIDDGFTCPICLGVLKDPMQCENNEHYFCSSCIKEHLEKTSLSCPVCNDKLTVETLHKAPRIIADYVSRLKINCDHAKKGCDAVLELGALQRHLQNCDFTPVACSNEGCLEVVCKRDVKHHELELCRFKKATCDDCGKKMPHHKYGAHGCVLRRDVDEIKSKQNEIIQGMQRMMTAMESLEKSCRNVSNAINARRSDIVVIGGADFDGKEIFSSVERFNLFNQTWKLLPELKQARYASAAVLFENQLLVCGGFISRATVTNNIEALDVNGTPTEWQKFSVNLPIKVGGHKCVVYGNRMLIIGGGNERGEVLDTIYELLLVPPYSSKLLCHMKKKRAFHAAELFDDKVLIAGGRVETHAISVISQVEIFDITHNECVEMPPLPSPLWAMATVRRDDTMLLIGGRESTDNEHKYSNEILEYNLKTGESKVQLVMKTKRAACAAVCHGDTLLVIGGEKDNPNAVDCYNLSSGSWRKLPSMINGRFFASAIIVNKEKFEF